MLLVLVMLRVDYSNDLSYGFHTCTISRLQAVQNTAARIANEEKIRGHDTMSRALELWIYCRLLLYSYKELHGLVWCHLCELVASYGSRRVLRSAQLK